jgi:hypothetical protein
LSARRRHNDAFPGPTASRVAAFGTDREEGLPATLGAPPATLRDSEAAAGADRSAGFVESKKDAPVVQVGRPKPSPQEAPSPKRVASLTRPPAVGVFLAPVLATRPVAPPGTYAALLDDPSIAAVERGKASSAVEFGRPTPHQEAPLPERVASPPSFARAVLASPAPDLATPPVLSPGAEDSAPGSDPAAGLASLPEGIPGRVLIRYLTKSADARAEAENLAHALAGQGVEVADLRESAGAMRTELSFSYAPDEATAREVGRLAGVAPVFRIQPRHSLIVRPGTVELNLSGDSRTARRSTTLRRESNHE